MASHEIRKLRKKLRQIENLERLDRDLTEEETTKVNQKQSIRSQLLQLTSDSNSALSTAVMGDHSPCSGASLSTDTNTSLDVSGEQAHSDDSDNDDSSENTSTNKDVSNKLPSPTQSTAHKSEPRSTQKATVTAPGPVVSGVMKTVSNTSCSVSAPASSVETVSRPNDDGLLPQSAVERSSNYSVRQLYGHSAPVRCLAVMDNYLVTGSQDTTVKVWDLSSGAELRNFGGHTQSVSGVLILSGAVSDQLVNELNSADINDSYDFTSSFTQTSESSGRQLIVSVSHDCNIRVWDLESDGGKLELWSVGSSAPVQSMLAHNDAITALAVEGNYIYSGSADGFINVYEWRASDRCLHRVFESTDIKTSAGSLLSHRIIQCLTVHQEIIFYGDDGMNIKVLDWRNGIVTKLTNHTTEFGSTCGLSVMNGLLVSSGYDLDNGLGYLNVRSVADGLYHYTLCDEQTSFIESIACTSAPNSRHVIIVTGGLQLKVWTPVVDEIGTEVESDVIKPVYVSHFNKDARNSDVETDSEYESSETDSVSEDQRLPWQRKADVVDKPGWFSWCAIV